MAYVGQALAYSEVAECRPAGDSVQVVSNVVKGGTYDGDVMFSAVESSRDQEGERSGVVWGGERKPCY